MNILNIEIINKDHLYVKRIISNCNHLKVLFFISAIIILSGCSFNTTFQIINLSNNNINVKYRLAENIKNNVIFVKPEKGKKYIFSLAKNEHEIEIDYDSGRSDNKVNENNYIEFELKTNEILILGDKRGPYTKDKNSSMYKKFNINYLEIENGKDSIILVNESVPLLFTKIGQHEYGIKIE